MRPIRLFPFFSSFFLLRVVTWAIRLRHLRGQLMHLHTSIIPMLFDMLASRTRPHSRSLPSPTFYTPILLLRACMPSTLDSPRVHPLTASALGPRQPTRLVHALWDAAYLSLACILHGYGVARNSSIIFDLGFFYFQSSIPPIACWLPHLLFLLNTSTSALPSPLLLSSYLTPCSLLLISFSPSHPNFLVQLFIYFIPI